MILILSAIFTAIIISCEKENDSEERTASMSSRFNQSESHNAGKDCMTCHKTGGSGKGVFTVAGTVYNAAKTAVYPNATVKLYTEAKGSGTLLQTIEVDARGNFYSTANVNFGTGIFATVTNSAGTVSKMDTPITAGNCNSCHSLTNSRITVN